MAAVGRFFLRARHWQLFTLFMGLYFPGVVFIFAVNSGAAPKSGGLMVGETIVFFLWMLSFLGWMGSMGIFLNRLKGSSLRTGTRLLWFALIYTPLYVVVFVADFFSPGAAVSAWIIVPPHLLAMFCIFYAAYFASKNLAMAEKSGPVTFYDYAGPLFLIWFFPVGVWFVQPRINRLYAQNRNRQAGAEPAAQ